jgi:hypothetical protein
MGHQEKVAYLTAIRKRYRKGKRRTKKAILDEFCAVCGYHRKHAIRLLGKHENTRSKAKRGRKSTYTEPRFFKALQNLWKASDFICSRRLLAVIPLWLPFYEQSFGALDADVRSRLVSISRATLDRILKPLRARYRKGLCGTKPGSMLRNHIPIRTDNWDITRPGFMEADTVAHCGTSLAGEFVWSLTMTDIHTAWTECRAVWNKGSQGVIEQVTDIERHIPFVLQGFDCDNGSEFLNYHLERYFAVRDTPVQFTRSRPYKKNDNAHVEQKNWAHARHLLGYDRIENPDTLPLINDLYANEWSLYQNHFCPSLKLKTKTRIGSKYRKTYDPPKTSYQRILESPDIAPDIKQALQITHASLNPFHLKKTIEQKLKAIFKLVSVTSFVRHRI